MFFFFWGGGGGGGGGVEYKIGDRCSIHKIGRVKEGVFGTLRAKYLLFIKY